MKNMEFSQNNVNFGARILYPMMIKKVLGKSHELVAANFSEITPKSKNDMRLVNDLFYNWRLTNTPDKCIANLKINFKDDFCSKKEPIYNYFITRLTSKRGKTPLKTCSASVVKAEQDVLKITQLQSVSSVITPTAILPKVKGAGELNILGIVKWAKEKGFQRIELLSMVDSFYEKIGFKKIVRDTKSAIDDTTHYLDRNMFDSFIRRIENKYKVNS